MFLLFALLVASVVGQSTANAHLRFTMASNTGSVPALAITPASPTNVIAPNEEFGCFPVTVNVDDAANSDCSVGMVVCSPDTAPFPSFGSADSFQSTSASELFVRFSSSCTTATLVTLPNQFGLCPRYVVTNGPNSGSSDTEEFYGGYVGTLSGGLCELDVNIDNTDFGDDNTAVYVSSSLLGTESFFIDFLPSGTPVALADDAVVGDWSVTPSSGDSLLVQDAVEALFESRFLSIEGDVDTLQSEVVQAQLDIENLQDDVETLETELDTLETEVDLNDLAIAANSLAIGTINSVTVPIATALNSLLCSTTCLSQRTSVINALDSLSTYSTPSVNSVSEDRSTVQDFRDWTGYEAIWFNIDINPTDLDEDEQESVLTNWVSNFEAQINTSASLIQATKDEDSETETSVDYVIVVQVEIDLVPGYDARIAAPASSTVATFAVLAVALFAQFF